MIVHLASALFPGQKMKIPNISKQIFCFLHAVNCSATFLWSLLQTAIDIDCYSQHLCLKFSWCGRPATRYLKRTKVASNRRCSTWADSFTEIEKSMVKYLNKADRPFSDLFISNTLRYRNYTNTCCTYTIQSWKLHSARCSIIWPCHSGSSWSQRVLRFNWISLHSDA